VNVIATWGACVNFWGPIFGEKLVVLGEFPCCVVGLCGNALRSLVFSYVIKKRTKLLRRRHLRGQLSCRVTLWWLTSGEPAEKRNASPTNLKISSVILISWSAWSEPCIAFCALAVFKDNPHIKKLPSRSADIGQIGWSCWFRQSADRPGRNPSGFHARDLKKASVSMIWSYNSRSAYDATRSADQTVVSLISAF